MIKSQVLILLLLSSTVGGRTLSALALADEPDAPAVFAKPFSQVDFSNVNSSVNDVPRLKNLFFKLRDDRFLTWDQMPNFKRRIPWLYVRQGCSDRATLMRQHIEELGMPVPTRVFAFPTAGKSLILRSPFWTSPIIWSSYHTALITHVDGQDYVIDPAASPEGPVLVKDWASKLGDGDPEKVQLAVCGPLSSSAERSCWETNPQIAYKILISQILLEYEWDEVQNLSPVYSHDQNVVLGDSPPWLKGN